MKLDRKKFMTNMGFSETLEGYRDALDFLISEINEGVSFKETKEFRTSAVPKMVLHRMEFPGALPGVHPSKQKGLPFEEACLALDSLRGMSPGTTKRWMLRNEHKESCPGGATWRQLRNHIEQNRELILKEYGWIESASSDETSS